MHKNKMIRIFFSSMMLAVLFFGDLALAATNVNYGTTTFFSGEDEKPPVSQPILDHGHGTSGRKRSDSKNSDDSDKSDDGNLFDQIIGGIGSLFGDSDPNSSGMDEYGKRSLFDFQSGDDSDGNGDGSSSDDGSGQEYIMGPRGESYENLDESEAAKYQSKFAQSFNFGDGSGTTAPKKSKLLFTNVEVPIDMTTQYVLIGLSFFVAVGSAIGYYFWKKEAGAEDEKYNSNDEI